MDDDVASAALDLLQWNKRRAIHLAWLGPLTCGPGAAALVALMASDEREQGLLPLATRMLVFTLPLAVVIFGALAFWVYSAADQRERRLRQQLGRPVGDRSRRARAARSAGRAATAVLMGVFLTPLILIPVRILSFLLSLLGVPIDAVPEEVGLALGAVAVVVITTYSYRWLRSNPASPLLQEKRTDS